MGKDGRLVTGSRAHRNLSKDIAAEGTVLLKNDGVLPLKEGKKVCPFGDGFSGFLFGGGGSGWVESRNLVSLADGLYAENQKGSLQVFSPLLEHYRAVCPYGSSGGNEIRSFAPDRPPVFPALPDSLYAEAKVFGGIALFCISRFSTESNVFDRSGQEGDFLLTPAEKLLFERLCNDFEKVIVILNVCGPVSTAEFKDNPKVGAVLYPMFSGGAAGEVLCELLLGKRYPSGHLQDTLAYRIEDYPSTANFAQYRDHVDYEEDIFVGYRYFETFAPEKVVYPFGFGLSYTTFEIACGDARQEGNTVKVTASVTNTGSHPGKEVVQLYLTAPQGKLGKAAKVLTAFQKTKELLPGESCHVTLSFRLKDFGSFDDLGKIRKSAFILEKGEYTVRMGVNVRDCSPVLTFALEEDIICRQCHSYMAPNKLEKRLTADGSFEALPAPETHKQPAPKYKTNAVPEKIDLPTALAENKLDTLLAAMTDAQLGQLLYGHPMMHVSNTCGIGAPVASRYPAMQIPLVPTADGPAGFRATFYTDINATFFPCANVLAQTWQPKWAEKMGKAGALEVKENNAGIWLAPALNIHRNPMCGRNFEYYSEDPLISGHFAAAFVKGVQSQKIAATVKHFCCNNKETNRRDSDSRVSERALREIYLRGFEIAVKQANPWAVMTSYNLLNGQRSSANWDAIEGILKKEWKYQGLVMTDWSAFSTLDQELLAGSNVKMPNSITGSNEDFDFTKSIADGLLTREQLLYSAKKVFELLGHLE